MKFTQSIIAITLSLGATSAFGIKTSPSVGINFRTNAPFVGRENAMVQHIGIDGQRSKVDNFVSFYKSQFGLGNKPAEWIMNTLM